MGVGIWCVIVLVCYEIWSEVRAINGEAQRLSYRRRERLRGET